MKQFHRTSAVAFLALITATVGTSGLASASTVTVSSVGAVSYGDPTQATLYNVANTSIAAYSGLINQNGWDPYTGQVGSPNDVNPKTNPGWISIGGASGTASVDFSFSTPNTTSMSFVWGSPSNTNLITFMNGNTTIGQVKALEGTSQGVELLSADGTSNNFNVQVANLANSQSSGQTGYKITITSSQAFTDAIFTNSAGGFEISGVSAVPIPAALPMFGAALIGLGGLAHRRAKKTA
ncbi:MAG TPA: hypothetical protein HPQ04_10715 [Rhodospirillaceae bacterium]|nr:hypothetical protein [Rhodospirillaceae bacterium]